MKRLSPTENLDLLARHWRAARLHWWADPPVETRRATGRSPAGARVNRQWLRMPVLL
jgi:hypothetical protein